MRRLAALALLAACSAPTPASPRPAVATELPAARGDASFDPRDRYPDGSRIVVLDLARPDAAPRVISGGFVAAGAPSVRADGARIAFVARETASSPFEVWTCAADSPRREDVERAGAAGAADCESAAFLADGRIVFSAATSPSSWALFVTGAPGAAAERITFSGGVDVDPSVLPDGRIAFASRAPGATEFTALTVHPDGTGVALRPDTPRDEAPRGAASRIVEIASLAPRPRPQGHLSIVDPAKKYGDVFCVDARPAGDGGARRVRFVPLDGSAATLGDVPLEADGSFFVRVPSDLPLGLELLDEKGHAVAAQHAPFWVRPGETRGCIGCHEDPDTTPPNVRPAAVLHDPAPLGVVILPRGAR